MSQNTVPNTSRIHVEEKSITLELPPEGFRLVNGSLLPSITVAYETYGAFNSDKSNGILVCSPLSMDAHAAGWYSDEDSQPGWWDNMIGPGKAMDTNRYCVIATNMLGGCRGTTGPSSMNPETNRPYGANFPKITIQDIVRVQFLLISQLGVSKLEAVLGGSMGGMQALQWSVAYPKHIKKCICLASGTHLSPQALGFKIVGRKVLTTDKHYAGGDYYQQKNAPDKGLAFARMIGLLTYLSAESMQTKFGRNRDKSKIVDNFDTGYEVENYLTYNAHKFTQRFDGNSYLHLTYAMDTFDLEAQYGTLTQAFEHSDVEFLLVSLSSDWLFPTSQHRSLCHELLKMGKIVTMVELDSPLGHDAFLLEDGQLGNVMRAFLEKSNGHTHNQDQISEAPAPTEGPMIDFTDGHKYLEKMISPSSHILDIGCGDGNLIDKLYHSRGITGFGIDISLQNLIQCLVKNVPVVHGDVDNGLILFGDNSFDYAVLIQTMQMLKKPEFVLQEMLRVAKKGIIVFPNFANIKNRISIALKGIMPITDGLPYNWWESPNIHLFTLKDFKNLCQAHHIQIDKIITICRSKLSKMCLMLGGENLGAELVIAQISKQTKSENSK